MSVDAVDIWSAPEYNKTVSFVYSTENIVSILTLLDPKPGDKIIDFGCGTGEITLKLSELVADVGLVVGIDSSQSMIDKARENGLQNVHIQDIQSLDDEFVSGLLVKHGQFDKVFSNAALHWCKRDPVGVIRSAKKVLKPGGAFAAEFGGWGNCIGVRSALHSALRRRGYDPIARDPWYFPSAESYAKLLISEGFEVVNISLVPRQTQMVGRILDWLRLFAIKTFFEGIDPGETEVMLGEVVDAFEVDANDPDSDRNLRSMRNATVLKEWVKMDLGST